MPNGKEPGPYKETGDPQDIEVVDEPVEEQPADKKEPGPHKETGESKET